MSEIDEIQQEGAAENFGSASPSPMGVSYGTYGHLEQLADAPYCAPNGEYQASIDNLRFRLKFRRDGGEWLKDHIDTFTCCDVSRSFTGKVIPGRYLVIGNFGYDDGTGHADTVTLGIGQIAGNSKINMHKGFIEFNPNKLVKHKQFHVLLKKIAQYVDRAECVRFDFAVDVPKKRTDLMVVKDHRKYTYVRSNGITEYLGVKNEPKYVKVYDKAAEQHIQADLTRIEITCDGAWTIEGMADAWPKVHSWAIDSEKLEQASSREYTAITALAISEVGVLGGNADMLISRLGRRSKAKVMNYLNAPYFDFPEEAARYVLDRVHRWELLQYPTDQ